MRTQRDNLEQQRRDLTTELIKEKLRPMADYNRIRELQQQLDYTINYIKNLD